MKVLIDTDPGTDDALAIMMALNSPELEVLGLTTVGGNASLTHTTRNTLSLLEYLGHQEVPVARGASRPLKGKFLYGYYYHGPGGLTVRLPRPRIRSVRVRAWDHIVSLASALRGGLTVIALGPLTNLARAMNQEPRVTDWLKEIVVMGGALAVPGNVTPHAEFNTYNDPHAARVVFESGVPVTLIGLDVCNQAVESRSEAPWYSDSSDSGRLASKILSNWFEADPDRNTYNLCDPLAAAAAISPGLLSYREAKVAVETEDPERMGKTTAIYGRGSVKVAVDGNMDEARQVIRCLVEGPSG